MSEETVITRPLTRRFLVKASLSAGFCAAISPVFAQVISTSAEGLVVGEVKVPVGDADIPAYRAMPDHGGPFPTVLVVHEAFGVQEHIKDICRRFARLGYYAIAPELFARQGDAAGEPDIQKLLSTIVFKKPDAEAMSDLDATLAFAKSTGSADVGRAAVVFAGAAGRYGSTRRTILRSRPRSPGTARWAGGSSSRPLLRATSTIRLTSSPISRSPYSGSTAARTRSLRSPRLRR
jgi:hypothetical protein